MSVISLTKIQNVLPEFIDTRLMPSAPDWMKFMLGASKPFALRRADVLITQNLPSAYTVIAYVAYSLRRQFSESDMTRFFLVHWSTNIIQ